MYISYKEYFTQKKKIYVPNVKAKAILIARLDKYLISHYNRLQRYCRYSAEVSCKQLY